MAPDEAGATKQGESVGELGNVACCLMPDSGQADRGNSWNRAQTSHMKCRQCRALGA